MGEVSCDCAAFLVAELARQGIEAAVSRLPPVVPTAYEPLNMRCPHGVKWHAEPTSDQQVAWAQDGVQ